MAIFTPVSHDEAAAFLATHDLGGLIAMEGIVEGVENTNYRLDTSVGRFILTLFEGRTDAASLPFCLGLTDHLAERGYPAARVMRNRSGARIGEINGRPAAILEWRDGVWLRRPGAPDVALAGRRLADLHRLGADFPLRRANPVGPPAWRDLARRCAERAGGTDQPMLESLVAELDRAEAVFEGAARLPGGAIHADYFPDNVLFANRDIGGVIDFYFACDGAYVYDLGIALNAWGFDAEGRPDREAMGAFVRGYEQGRRLSRAEREALPALAAASALRFTLTRLHDRLFHDPAWVVTPKDPAPFFRRIAFHAAADADTYGLAPADGVP